MTRAHSRHVLVCTLFALLVAGCALDDRPSASRDADPIDFTLTDHDSKPFQMASLRGNVALVFFGYTMCPDACPTTLSKLSSAFARLTAEERARVKTLYVTVDPERDTAEVMKDHLSYFGVGATGLVGSPQQIKAVADIFGVHFQKGTTQTAGGYTMSHTVSIFGIDASGRPSAVIAYESDVSDVIEAVRHLLARS